MMGGFLLFDIGGFLGFDLFGMIISTFWLVKLAVYLDKSYRVYSVIYIV